MLLPLVQSSIQMNTAAKKSRESWYSEDSNRKIRKHNQEQRCVIKDQAKLIHIFIFSITMYGCKSWNDYKADSEKKSDSFEIWCWKKALQILWFSGKTTKWVLDLIKLETALEAIMKKVKHATLGTF